MEPMSMDSAPYFLVVRRNNSLSRSERRWAFAIVCAVSFLIALAFGMIGAWPVFPFAGLEMLVLYVAFRYIDRHAGDYERLEISGDQVRLELRLGSQVSVQVMNRYWAQVVVGEGADHHCRVTLRSHGRECELGRYLMDEDRLKLAQEIRRQLQQEEVRPIAPRP